MSDSNYAPWATRRDEAPNDRLKRFVSEVSAYPRRAAFLLETMDRRALNPADRIAYAQALALIAIADALQKREP
jgi:hypothetical protein